MHGTKKLLSLIVSILFASNIKAAVMCEGTITQVYKWHHMERVSVLLSSTNKWINMPTKTDESMALMAFAANKPVKFYWAAEDVTSCIDGWANNRVLNGYFVILAK